MSSGELVFRTGNLEHVDFRSFGKILNWDFLEVKNIAFQKLKEIPRVRIFDGISPTTVWDMFEVDDAAQYCEAAHLLAVIRGSPYYAS